MDRNTKVVFDRLKNIDIKVNHFINLNGTTIDTKEDLANLCDVYRNPKYETFRIFYIKDSKIVGQEAYTNKIPNSVYLFEKSKVLSDYTRGYAEIKARMKRLNADGYYLAHNHSSESSKPSNPDIRATKKIAENVNGFLGHLILGATNRYSFIEIDEYGTLSISNEETVSSKELKLMSKELSNNDYKDIKIDSRTSLVALLKTITRSKEYSTAILTNAVNKVQMILDVPNRIFNHSTYELKGYFRNIAREHGATKVFIGTEDKDVFDKLDKHIDYGTIKDGIYFDKYPEEPQSYKGRTTISEYDLFDKTFFDVMKDLKFVRESEDNYMREEKLKILYKRVGQEPVEMEIENTLEAKQKLVDGLIEVVQYYDAVLICNEEGKLMNLLPNVAFDCDYIAGDFFIVGDDYENGDFKSLTKEQIEEYKKDLEPRSFEYKDLIPKDKTKDDTKEKNVKEKENLELE